MQSKDRTYQVVAIVGLIVGVMALTIGFAAFTTTLTIESAADVTPASTTLDVVFSSSSSSVATNAPTVTPSGATGATGGTATLTGTRVSGIVAHFTQPGQTVTYDWYVYNNSAYTAYLNEIKFNTVSGSNPASFKVCQAKTGSSNQATNDIETACNGITLTLTVHGISTTASKSTSDMAAYNPLKTLDTSSNKSTAISVAIEYASGSAVPDGDIEVAFGDIESIYKSVAPSGS
jgi:hypothetical protein